MPNREFLTSPRRLVLILLFVVLFGIVLFGASTARKKALNSVIDWLPAKFQETQTFFEYLYLFHEGELLMVSWDDCELEDPRQEEIANFLTTSSSPAYYDRAFTTTRILDELMADPVNLTRERAIERMQGWIASRDGHSGCIVLFISEAGRKDRHAAIAAVYKAAETVLNLPPEKVYVAGPTVDSVAIDEASAASQAVLVPFFLVFCLFLLFLCLRSYRAVFIVFWAAIINNQMGEACIYYLGLIAGPVNGTLESVGLGDWSMRHFHADSISVLVGSLCYVLTISGGIHIINYYREEVMEDGVPGAPIRAFRRAFLPCFLASLTTIMGLGSLAISKVVPIQNFGIFATITLVLGTALLFLVTLTLLEQSPITRWKVPRTQNLFLSFWIFLSKYIERHRYVITVLSFAVLLWGSLGIEKIKTTVTLHGMFTPQAKVIQDYNHLEQNIGGLIPVQLILSIPKEGNEGVSMLDQLVLLGRVGDEIYQVESVNTILTALTFMPNLPSQTGTARDVGYRRAFNRVVQARSSRLEEIKFFKETEEEYHWRLDIRIPAYLNKEYGPLLAELQAKAQAVIDQPESGKIRSVKPWVTGAIPLVHRAQEQLLYDLVESYIVAFILITITMMILLRGIWSGLLSMVPNVFPTAIVFGFMGWFALPVDMGSMMTASVALGIAIDGTLHFLTWFYRGMEEGQTRQEAVKFAYTRCATAMTQTTIVCGIGMLVFCGDGFIPVARFAWLMCVLLFLALVGDLVTLPALLYSPLGKLFVKKVKEQSPENGVENADSKPESPPAP